MNKLFAGAIAAVAIAACAATARADDVCAWRGMGVWQCGDGHVVTQVYQLPTQPNTVITPVTTVTPTPAPAANDGSQPK